MTINDQFVSQATNTAAMSTTELVKTLIAQGELSKTQEIVGTWSGAFSQIHAVLLKAHHEAAAENRELALQSAFPGSSFVTEADVPKLANVEPAPPPHPADATVVPILNAPSVNLSEGF